MKALLNSTCALLLMLSAVKSSPAADPSSLKPPPGAKVAVVVFEDLQCGDSARAYPLVMQAAGAHHVPVVLYGFPLPMHNWSFDAEVWARFFDDKSEKLGSHFREYIYANQTKITFAKLQQFVQKFGDENKIPIPAANDPDGKLAERVKADYALAQQIGLVHTPTIFVVGRNTISRPFVEVVNGDQLNQFIEDMLKKAEPEAPAHQVSKGKLR
jgi:protein-disulfide isomerase